MRPEELITTTQRIVSDPKKFWGEHRVGSKSVAEIVAFYLLPLAVLSGVCTFIQATIIGYRIPLLEPVFRESFFGGIWLGLQNSVVVVISSLLAALVLQKILPMVQGQASYQGSLEFIALVGLVSVFATPFGLLPWIGWLIVLAAAVYSLYIFWLGMPSQLQVPPENRLKLLGLNFVVWLGLVGLYVLLVGSSLNSM